MKTMIPLASVLALSVASIAHADPASPQQAAKSKPAAAMEGKCGAGMKMDSAHTSQQKPHAPAKQPKAKEAKCGGMK